MKNRKYLYYFVILILLISIQTNTYAIIKDKTMLTKPYLYLNIKISGCTYNAKINDVSIMNDSDGLPVDTRMPINQWINNDKNTLALNIAPIKDAEKYSQLPASECTADLELILEDNEGTSKPIILTTINFKSNPNEISTKEGNLATSLPQGNFILTNNNNSIQKENGGDIVVSKIKTEPFNGEFGSGVALSRSIQIPLDLPKWSWIEHGETINQTPETKIQLLDQYNIIWKALKNHSANKIAPLFHLRNSEYAEAYYSTEKKMQDKLGLEDIANNPDLIPTPIIPKYTYLKVFGNGKLATLVSWDHTTPILALNYTDKSSFITIPVIFAKINDKWVIVR